MIGKVLNGESGRPQFKVVEMINRGGFGQVYKGIDQINNTQVAIKIAEILDIEYKDTLLREINISSKLENENIVRTFFTNFDEKDNYLYIIMEYLENGSLFDYLDKQNDFIPLDMCIKMFEDILNGVGYAHNEIIHRDLKPQNILISNGFTCKICDFGLSKFVGDSTRTQSFKGGGTYAYMSPESWCGETNTIAMDIYSLGLIFFEILTLKRAFNAANTTELRECHLFNALPDITHIRKDVPVLLKGIIEKMSNKRVSERYSTIDKILEELDKLKKQLENKNSSADALAELANNIILQQQREKSEALKKQEKEMNNKKLLNYTIDELTTKFNDKVSMINERLTVGDKVDIQRKKNKDGISEFKIFFKRRVLEVEFFGINDIDSYVKSQKDQAIKFQLNNYGFIAHSASDSFYKKENIIFIGLLKLTGCSFNYSGNLILKKENENDLYGNWYIALFKDNAFNSNPSPLPYGLTRDLFYKEYESSLTAMHVKKVSQNRLTNEIIDEWLKYFLV